MNNSFFLYSKQKEIEIERFHICTWEFDKAKSLIEFGFEIDTKKISSEIITLELVVPWISKNTEVVDYYRKLINTENSRFIFNDSITKTISLDGGQNKAGVIHSFSQREDLNILPLENIIIEKSKLEFSITLKKANECNPYIRFAIESNHESISTYNKGLNKSTRIYDIKINENRNIPEKLHSKINFENVCSIKNCFCFHIIPNNYDMTFLESEHLKNVRKLEFEPFNRYFNDSRLKKDNLIVIFLKKRGNESYSFFSIFTKERIGINQILIAIFLNMVCAFLFSLPTIRDKIIIDDRLLISNTPIEYIIALCIIVSMSIYFSAPKIYNLIRTIFNK